MRTITTLLLATLAVPGLALSARALPQCPVQWEATDGVLPHDATPPWTLIDSSTTPPALGPGSLTLQTSTNGQNQFYKQAGSELVIPPLLIFEAGVRYVSGSSSSTVREAIAIVVEMPAGLGNNFFIGTDEIFLLGGTECLTKGNSAAVLTTDGFHDYRLEVDTASGSISVFYDGQLTLTGSLHPVTGGCSASTPRLLWGEISVATTGTSEWAYVRHNAGATGSVVSYCTAGTSASGCRATLSASGSASASAASGFLLSAANFEGNKNGFFVYGTGGRRADPWGTGTSYQCVVLPVSRGRLLSGSGTRGTCNGSIAQDVNALWLATPSKNPGAGASVQTQLWYRDPLNSSNQTTSWSDAIEFSVCPL